MTTQIAVKLPDEMVDAIDRLVATGRFASRSEAVRRGLDRVVRDVQSQEIDQAFTDGLRRMPERADELADAERLARQAIADEPWEKWW